MPFVGLAALRDMHQQQQHLLANGASNVFARMKEDHLRELVSNTHVKNFMKVLQSKTVSKVKLVPPVRTVRGALCDVELPILGIRCSTNGKDTPLRRS